MRILHASSDSRTGRRTPGDRVLASYVRAARAFADLDQETVAEMLGISTATYKRIERAERPVSEKEQHGIARACGVPDGFLREGFSYRSDDTLAWAVLQELRALRADIQGREQVSEELAAGIRRAREALGLGADGVG